MKRVGWLFCFLLGAGAARAQEPVPPPAADPQAKPPAADDKEKAKDAAPAPAEASKENRKEAVPPPAKDDVPPDGMKAEMDKRWDDAIRIYKSAIEVDPKRANLWVRIADIEVVLGRPEEAVEALRRATEADPKDASLHIKLARAYSAAGQTAKAYEACDRAVALEPKNLEYLKVRALYANWAGKSDPAVETCRRILALSPDDDETRLLLARLQSWGGELDAASGTFQEYLKKHPEDKDADLDYIRNEAYRGNFSRAMDLLDDYRGRFGESQDERKLRARVLASARRPAEAQKLNEPLLREAPLNYETHYTDTVILHYGRRPREAANSLSILDDLQPRSEQTDGIRRFVLTDQRSAVSVGFDTYHESDSLTILHPHARGHWQIDPETRLTAGAEEHHLRADRGSGLEEIDGDEAADHVKAWLGIEHRFSPEAYLSLRAGAAEADTDHQAVTYHFRGEFTPLDNLTLTADSDYDFYVISPRSVSLGIRDLSNRLRLQWEPDLNWVVDVSGAYDRLSDDNSRWEALVGPRRAIVRSQYLSLDIGPQAWWFGYDEHRGHGYYDPAWSQRYAINVYPYWKISPEDGVGFVVSPGVQEDEFTRRFKYGTSYSLEATFGAHRDCMLKLHAGATNNISAAGGSFRAIDLGVEVTIRF